MHAAPDKHRQRSGRGDPLGRPPELNRLRDAVQVVNSRSALWRNELLRLIRNFNGTSRPVFVVGCGRSGTSMLTFQLAKSWQVEPYNEDHPSAFENYRLRELEVIEALVHRSRAPVVLFKPILNTPQTSDLLRSFPQARVIFVFRHFDDVVNSSLRRFGRESRLNHLRDWMATDFAEFSFSPPPERTKDIIRSMWEPQLSPESAAALYWLFYNRLFEDMRLSDDERVGLFRYETAVSEPLATFQSLTSFLELRFEPRMAHGIFASSMGREAVPEIEGRIREACESLWESLSGLEASRRRDLYV